MYNPCATAMRPCVKLLCPLVVDVAAVSDDADAVAAAAAAGGGGGNDDNEGQHQLTTFNHQSKVLVGGKTDESGNAVQQFRGTISGTAADRCAIFTRASAGTSCGPASVCLSVSLSVSVCVLLSVTSRCSIKRNERINFAFGMEYRCFFDQSYTAF